ncbi:MAG: sulfurtransferase TusA family protein [Planctomycetota bacterium]|jgi:TusA-related sulfurtransferase
MKGVEAIVPDDTLTAVGEECPMNYVRTKLRLEKLGEGEVLEVFVSGGEPARNVPRSARDDGHEVLLVEPTAEGSVRLLIRKREADGGP